MASKPGISASSSLNAAILAKKEAEKKAAEKKEEEKASRLAATKSTEIHATGWWATSDTGNMNADEEAAKAAKAKAGFTSQFDLTGQSGIGSSLFNIQRSSSEAPSSPGAETKAVEIASELAGAVASKLGLNEAKVGSPSHGSAPPPGEEDKAGWWSKMDNGLLNKEEEQLDRKAKQGFTPQLMSGSGLVNRMVPLSAGSGSLDSPKKISA